MNIRKPNTQMQLHLKSIVCALHFSFSFDSTIGLLKVNDSAPHLFFFSLGFQPFLLILLNFFLFSCCFHRSVINLKKHFFDNHLQCDPVCFCVVGTMFMVPLSLYCQLKWRFLMPMQEE